MSKSTSQKIPVKNNKAIGIGLLVVPFVLICFVLISFVIVNTLLHAADPSTQSESLNSIRVIANYVLGILGVLTPVAFLVCIPLGIMYLVKGNAPLTTFDKRSGKLDQSVVPEEIRGWNWGAAGLSIIWGLYYSVWITLLNFVPIINMIWWIVMGIYGNEWAWRKNKWESVEAFQTSQNKWKPWGMLFLLGPIVIAILIVMLSIYQRLQMYA